MPICAKNVLNILPRWPKHLLQIITAVAFSFALKAEHPDQTLQALSEGRLPLAHTPHDLLTAWAAQTGYAPELFFARGLEAASGASETKKTQRMFVGLRVIVQHWADYLVGAAVRNEKHRI